MVAIEERQRDDCITHDFETMALGALSSRDGIIGAFEKHDTGLDQDYIIDDLKVAWGFHSKTASSTQGPISVHLGIGFTSTTFASYIAGDPQYHKDPDAPGIQTYYARQVPLGVIQVQEANGAMDWHTEFKNIRWPSWVIETGEALQLCAYNWSGSTLTTGGIVQANIQTNRRWINRND